MADLKEFLRSVKSPKNQNLYDHLSNIFTKILLESPKNAYDFFEDYSFDIKSNGFDFKKSQDLKKPNEKYEEIAEFSVKSRALIDKIMIGNEVEELQEPGPCGYVPNFLEESKWFEWAGIYFGEEMSYKIFKSLTRLCIGKSLKQIKFWGKIIGSKKDYFVAEGISEEAGDQGELPPNVELKGSGVNKLNYWVTNDIIFGDWIELPLLIPEQLISARKIKYMFSGDLERDVIINPYFFGKEKHLLKAQITRISHATSLVPTNIWRKQEGEEREIEFIEVDDNWKFPSFDSLKLKENWLHLTPSILKQGRITHFKPEFAPEADEEIEMKKIVAKDPFEPRLKSIKDDFSTNGIESAWSIKVYGDQMKYNVSGPSKGETHNNYAIIAIKSLNWPGSITVMNGQNHASIYVGYGFKASESVFFPKEPQRIQVEPVDIEEQIEPNFPKEEKLENADNKDNAGGDQAQDDGDN